MKKEFEMLEKLMKENKDVLYRLKNEDEEYYTSEKVKNQYLVKKEK